MQQNGSDTKKVQFPDYSQLQATPPNKYTPGRQSDDQESGLGQRNYNQNSGREQSNPNQQSSHNLNQQSGHEHRNPTEKSGGGQPNATQQPSGDKSDLQRQQEIERQMKLADYEKKAQKKIVIGTGYNMDITQFFKFSKKKEQDEKKDQKSLIAQISGSRLAWLILLYSVTNGAMIPPWLMSIPANKLLRQAWRFFMQTFIVLPFLLYEYRTCDQATRQKYSVKYIFKPSNIIKPFVSSLSTILWMSIVLNSMEWTSVCHCCVLGTLPNFFLCLQRTRNGKSHDLQIGGEFLVLLGIIMTVFDTCRLSPDQISAHDLDVRNTLYFTRPLFGRLLFDFVCIFMSWATAKFSQYTSDMRNYYPPFLSMYIVNLFNLIHLIFSAFIINGCTFDFHSFFGIWSIFSDLHFSGFMYMAIMLSFGQMVSILLITKMFPDPIIPALALSLDPFIASFLCDIVGVQRLPGTFTVMAFVLMVPGLFLILIGQCLYQRMGSTKELKEKQDQKRQQLMEELRAIKQRRQRRKEIHERKMNQEPQEQLRKVQTM